MGDRRMTIRQQEVFNFLVLNPKATDKEIIKWFKFKTRSHLYYFINLFIEKGYLTRTEKSPRWVIGS